MTFGITLFNGTIIAGDSYENKGELKAGSSGKPGISSDEIVTVTNHGLIDSPDSYAVTLKAGSTFRNSESGTVTSRATVGIAIGRAQNDKRGTIFNYGLISGRNGGSGAAIAGIVDLTNGSKANTAARIEGSVSFEGNSTSRITNFGTITGGAGAGTGGVINGAIDSTAAFIGGGVQSSGDVANFGTVISTGGDGASVNPSYPDGTPPGTITNGHSGSTVATIIGALNGIALGPKRTVRNFGTVIGQSGRGVEGNSSAVFNGAPGATAAIISGLVGGIQTSAARWKWRLRIGG